MALARGNVGGYEYNRMVVQFSMMDGAREIQCAVSASAMDDIEHVSRTAPDQREQQFLRLRDRIEQRAVEKFVAWRLRRQPCRHHPARHRFSKNWRLIASSQVSHGG